MVPVEKLSHILPVTSARVAYASIQERNGISKPSKKKTFQKIKLQTVNSISASKQHFKGKLKNGEIQMDKTTKNKPVQGSSSSEHVKKYKKVTSSVIEDIQVKKKCAKKRKLDKHPPNLVNLEVIQNVTDHSPEKSSGISDSDLNDSSKLGVAKFKWIIFPVSKDMFFRQYWEKKALYIKRNDKKYYRGLFSTNIINNILNTQNVQFTKNVDLASYKDGKRETHNPEGRALAPVVWDHFNNGCSVRLLNPQTFHEPVWKLLATLQEYFQSFCGANVYLTPPGTQGFAPHWDDIEAFILQLEGKKRWRVYSPRTEDETLPRESSQNFGPSDYLGNPVLDVILEPGDLIYFPRGFIHQGEALEDIHSLHITFSTYQKTAWFDILEKLLPATLLTAAAEDVEFRKGLPIGYGNFGGVAYSEIKSSVKEQFTKKLNELVGKMMQYAPVDAAIDQMIKGFMHDSLPPVLDEEEKNCSVYGGGESWSTSLKKVVNRVELAPDSEIRLLRKGCVRMVVEEDSIRLYHSTENSREYHAEEPKFVELAVEMGPGMEALIQTYPKFIKVEDLPLPSLSDKLTLAMGLWEKGLITTYEPLFSDDD